MRSAGPDDARLQGLTLDHFEDQGVETVDVLDAVDRGDIGVIQRRQHARFALEPRQPFGIRGEDRRQDLDRDFTSECGIACAIHLAHAT